MFVTNAERRRWLSFELRRRQIKLSPYSVSEYIWDRYSIYIMNTDENYPKTYDEWLNS